MANQFYASKTNLPLAPFGPPHPPASYKCPLCHSPYCTNGSCCTVNINPPYTQVIDKPFDFGGLTFPGVSDTSKNKPSVGRLFRIPVNGRTQDVTEAEARALVKDLRKQANAIEKALKR